MGKILGGIKLLGISDLLVKANEAKPEAKPEAETEAEKGSAPKDKYRQVFKWLRNEGDCL